MNKILVSGKVEGIVLKSNDPINFLGTVDKKTGIISDKEHSLFEKSIKNSILVFPSGIGSSVGAYTIYSIKSNNTAPIAAKLASEGKVKIIVKGHIHTDVLMKEVLKREYNLLGKTRLSHIWHMTIDKDDNPLIITDGALNVLPNVKTKMHILKNVVNFSNRIGIERPKVSVLSATEEVLESVPSSIEAAEITKLAKEENLNADVFGPLAFDNSISKKSAAIKGIKNLVAGEADVLLVPNVEAGNALVKMLIYFSGACAAGVVVGGKVPVVITSRSDEAQARLASIAAAVVALD